MRIGLGGITGTNITSIGLGVSVGGGGGQPQPFVGPYDAIPSIAALYAMRRALSDYTGPILRLRRDSDNTEQDIGYVANGDLDVAAVAAFLDGANGHVTTWYDQSGNGNDAVQADPTMQPRYIQGGIAFDGSNDYLDLPLTPAASWSMVVQFSNAARGTTNRALIGSYNVNAGFQLDAWRASDEHRYLYAGNTLAMPGRLDNGIMGLAGSNAYLNGELEGDVGGTFSGTPNALVIGARRSNSGVSSHHFGNIHQVLISEITYDADAMAAIYAVMAADPPLTLGYVSSQTLYTTSGDDKWLGRCHLIDRGDGAWAHVYRSGQNHSVGGTLHIRFSTDQGVTWTDEDVFTNGDPVANFPLTPHSPADDIGGCMTAVAPNGDLLIITRESDTDDRYGSYVWRSTDGGATWTDEGKINDDDELTSVGDIITIDTDLYATFMIDPGADRSNPYKTALYKSTDNGESWTFVSDITAAGTNESTVLQTGDTSLLVVMRSDDSDHTYFRTSSNLGETWSDLVDMTARLGAIHRPHLRRIGSRIYLFGRERSASGSIGYNSVWYSDDNLRSWIGPYRCGNTVWADGGYMAMLPRDNGDLYVSVYEGISQMTAGIVEYVLRPL